MTAPANLILFQSDNHNRDLLGCYGHPIVKTPNVDRIAASGARFDNAYCTSSLCCPSRASLATGLYPHQTGYWDNCLVYDGSRPSWAARVRNQGHTAVSVGKLHFRSTEDDNGFSQEIAPMHIIDGVGGLIMLLRWSEAEPAQPGQWRLYSTESGVGTSNYQDYDREITRLAIQWLEKEAAKAEKPWVLYVSYTSAHPPFSVPERFWDMYPVDDMPLPVAFREGERPEHPAYAHLRRTKGIELMGAAHEAMLRRVAAGYFGLITHLDEQIGEVMDTAESLGLMHNTRLAYTSDHGESYGNHGLFGKCQLLETAAAVPLVMSGPGITPGQTVQQIVSQVDLFPTIVESVGAVAMEDDSSLPGVSLWPALAGKEEERLGFGEYHASCSHSGSFFLRRDSDKLIYHAGMPRELYDLKNDPHETRNRLDDRLDDAARAIADDLEKELRRICDPEAVDRQAKAAQRDRTNEFGGNDTVAKMGALTRTPPPGTAVELEPAT
ncbi:MAG: sulfatase-like hydrolase/transferase [Chromatiales bacterium]|jgi:choline-sulfatase|nr:sulfatase-like hydrolase/transferase [Chromatiales bacterium]